MTDSEIGNFDTMVIVEEEIGGFDISMDDSLKVEVL